MTPVNLDDVPEVWRQRLLVDDNGCWLWCKACNVYGYGVAYVGKVGRKSILKMAHRLIYESVVGDIPDGLDLDHLCRVHRCCNPAHLEPVTRAVNLARGRAAREPATHCRRGHPFTPENTAPGPQGGRLCRTCKQRRTREWTARKQPNGHSSPI